MNVSPETMEHWMFGLIAGVGVWLLGWLVTRLLLPLLARAIRKSRTDLDDHLLAAIKPHLPLWFLVIGAMVGARIGTLTGAPLLWIDRGGGAVLILSVTFAIATFLSRIILRATAGFADGALQSTSLVHQAVRLVIIALGVMVMLTNLGIAITPIITALGVGSLAVALALQPTLANMFAGFYISLARQLRVGDYVELETGQSGFVSDIGWRTTLIRELPNNLVVIPNAKLAELIVRNYSLPQDEQSVVIQVGVSYDSDLPEVERVTIEVAGEVLKSVEGGVPDFQPFTRYHTFGDSSINFSVILRVKTFTDRYLVTHEFVKRLKAAYDRHGIEIPFPQRVLRFPEELRVGRGDTDGRPALAEGAKPGEEVRKG